MSQIYVVPSDSSESSGEEAPSQRQPSSSRTIRAEERGRHNVEWDLAREDARRMYFDALMGVPFIPTRCADVDLLGRLGILEDVRTIFYTMGVGELPFVVESSSQDITCQFLASLTLHINPSHSNMHDLGHIAFSINGQPYQLSLHAVSTLFGLQEGTMTDLSYANFYNVDAVWRSISAEEYAGGVSKASTIRHPAIRYAHTFLAHTFYSRKDATTVEDREMVLLTMGIKPMLQRCVNKKPMFFISVTLSSLKLPLISRRLVFNKLL